jgi:hypothetical protein
LLPTSLPHYPESWMWLSPPPLHSSFPNNILHDKIVKTSG